MSGLRRSEWLLGLLAGQLSFALHSISVGIWYTPFSSNTSYKSVRSKSALGTRRAKLVLEIAVHSGKRFT